MSLGDEARRGPTWTAQALTPVSAGTTAEKDFEPRIATFFTLYPEPVGLPTDGSQVIYFGGDLRGYSTLQDLVIHYDGDKPFRSLDPRLAIHPFVSIRFHRGHRAQSRITQNVQDVLRVVREVAPYLGQDDVKEEDAKEDDPMALYSVVEMVTPLVKPQDGSWVPAPPSPEFMGPNLTMCIVGLREVMTAYRLTQNVLIPAPARERLGPTIIGSSRPADPAHGAWDDTGSLVFNAFSLGGHPGMPATPDTDELKKIGTFLYHRSLEHPTVALMELQADADTALNMGDFRSAVMLAYTAGEVLLDGVLMALCWEEGMAVGQAAEAFNVPLMNRVRTQYHLRLGGNWSSGAKSPVTRWRSELVLLRHHVAHAGLLPEREATDAALEAHRGLRAHVLDRLTASMRRYPKTVTMFVSPEGLQRRGAWTKKARKLAGDYRGDALRDFASWREAVLQARMLVGGIPGKSTKALR